MLVGRRCTIIFALVVLWAEQRLGSHVQSTSSFSPPAFMKALYLLEFITSFTFIVLELDKDLRPERSMDYTEQ